ncbi:hypothetical protein DCAR_0624198 [Daucus carota subsp. sativus]|uniref:Bifunctional inhibitor/plant lipid transfer protein/seed storage helical domain-containing protein n=1 Tax=Daucus carota subsp. sativus TaxID=79200 RepID=A0A161ZSB9_DAUCS|nr:hypothetical protein DCAR_0624198 [Daucus carota subsp. sativus]
MANSTFMVTIITVLFLVSGLTTLNGERCNFGVIIPCVPSFDDPKVQPSPTCCNGIKVQSQSCLCELIAMHRRLGDIFAVAAVILKCTGQSPQC